MCYHMEIPKSVPNAERRFFKHNGDFGSCYAGIIRDFFERKIPDVLQSALTFSFAFSFGGTDAEMLADGGEHFNTNVQFLSNAMGGKRPEPDIFFCA